MRSVFPVPIMFVSQVCVHSPMLFCIFSLIIILQLLPAAVCIQIATSVIAAGVMAKLVVVVKIARLAASGQAAVLKLLKIAMLAAVLAKIAVVLLANAAGVRDKHLQRISPISCLSVIHLAH